MSNKTISKIMFSLVAVLAFSTFTVINIAEARPQNAEQHQQYRAMAKLTDEQKASIKQLTEAQRKKTEPMRIQLVTKKAEYKALMAGTNPDPTKAGQLAGEIEKTRQEIATSQRAFQEQLTKDFNLPQRPMMAHGNKGRGSGRANENERDDRRNDKRHEHNRNSCCS